MKTKNLIILIVVVLIIAGGAGYYFYKTSQEQKEVEMAKSEQVIDETANWKVYRNEGYGYEVKYPEGWQFEGETGAPPSPLFTYRWSDDSYCRFNIVTTFADDSGQIADLKEKGYKETTYTVDGVIAIGLSKLTVGEAEDYIYYFDKNSNYYRIIRWSSGGIHEAECVSIFNQILSTFKFIEFKQVIDETADWKVYRNEEHGFSFSYPKNYQLLENTRGSLLGSIIEEPIPFSLVLLQDIYMDSAQTPLINLDVVKTSKTIEQLLDHVRKVINDQTKVLEDPRAPYYGAPPPEIKSVERVTIGDLKMTKIVHDIGPGGPNPILLEYYIAHPGYVFVFFANYGSPCSPGYCGETEKKDLPIMLSTFKFIK